MIRLILAFALGFLVACTGGGSSSSVSYKYKLSGVSPMTVSANEVESFANQFQLKWNESTAGVISGIYVDNSTGNTFSISGTSDTSGRTIRADLNPAVDGVSKVQFTIAQTGDLSGSVTARVKTFDSNDTELSSKDISVDAETVGATTPTPGEDEEDGDTGGGGGGGGTGTLASYNGLYAGTVTEVSNTNLGSAVGNGKYCDFTYGTSEFKVEYHAGYGNLSYSTKWSSGGGSSVVVPTNTDPAVVNISRSLGAYSPATLLDSGHDFTGLKIKAGDTSKVVGINFSGAFSGTTTKKFIGTITLKFDGVDICSFSLDLTKQ